MAEELRELVIKILESHATLSHRAQQFCPGC